MLAPATMAGEERRRRSPFREGGPLLVVVEVVGGRRYLRKPEAAPFAPNPGEGALEQSNQLRDVAVRDTEVPGLRLGRRQERRGRGARGRPRGPGGP